MIKICDKVLTWNQKHSSANIPALDVLHFRWLETWSWSKDYRTSWEGNAYAKRSQCHCHHGISHFCHTNVVQNQAFQLVSTIVNPILQFVILIHLSWISCFQLATGTGIAPFRAFLWKMFFEKHDDYKVEKYYHFVFVYETHTDISHGKEHASLILRPIRSCQIWRPMRWGLSPDIIIMKLLG